MTSIPRALVAEALFVAEDALPPGDLPLARLAERFLSYVRAGEEAAEDHPDAWAFDLVSALTGDHPELALAAVRATLAAAESPEDVALIAAGPLEDLLTEHGIALIDVVEALAADAPRFAFALTGVWPPEEGGNALLWARIEAARRGVASLDEGAALPPADGL